MAKIQEGDIVTINFPFDEKDQEKKRPAFVLRVDLELKMVLLAYCSTQKISSNPLPHELVIGEQEIKSIGLKKATRVDFKKRNRFSLEDVESCEVIGSALTLGNQFIRKLASACNAAGYR